MNANTRERAGIVLFFGFVLGFLFISSMGRNLNHDEHQFVAPAYLLATEGLQPYRDFPLFHLPNLTFLYAALFRALDHPFLVARCCSIAFSFLTAALVFRECWRRPPFGLARWRFPTAAVTVLLLIFDPLFYYATGRTWNHDSTALFLVLAILFQVNAARENSIPHAVASAVCAAIAAGIRITCAPILIPLWLSIWFFPSPFRRRSLIAAIYVVTATAALAPSLFFLATQRDPFLFGNFEFPRLRLLDPENERIRKTINPLRKLRFFFKEVAVPSLPLFLACIAFAFGPAWKFFRHRSADSFAPALVLSILPFALVGCFAPSRYQYQHFFIIIPLLTLAMALGSATIRQPQKWMLFLLPIIFLTSFGRFVYKIKVDSFPTVTSDWFPNRIAHVSTKMAEQSPRGPILTLAPIFPIEAGLPIYRQFSTGPFAWKSAHLVAPERRDQLHLIAPEDLDAFLAANPPGGILTGVEERRLEKPLLDYCLTHAFRPVDLGKKRTLWLPPEQ